MLDAVSGADAAVIVTEWDELRELASDEVRQAMRRPLILDGRNLLDPEQARARRLHLRGHRPRRLAARRASRDRRARASDRVLVEAIILAGGKAERLGEAAGGRPKALVELAGRPLAAYQVEQLAAAGVTRVLVSCAAGQEGAFEAALGGIGPEVVAVPEPEPLGRGGGIRLRGRGAARAGRRASR